MPYIGNNIRSADDYRLIDDISSGFNGNAKTFALQVGGSSPVPFPKTPQQCLISVNGVIQEPDPTGNSGFTLTGTNIVFSSAPTNGHSFFGIIYATADYLNAGGTFPDGAVGNPSITFTNDDDTGLYKKGSGAIGFVSNGVEITSVDGDGLTIADSIIHAGDTDTKIRFPSANEFSVETAGVERFEITPNEVTFNDTGADVDFRIEGDSVANLFKIDASVNNIGIGLAAPKFSSGNGIELADNFFLGFGSGNGTRPDFQVGTTAGATLDIRCGTGADTVDLVVNTNGHVGIGTTSPSGNLEIDTASTTSMIMLDVSGTNFARIGHNTSSGTNMLDVRSEGHTRFLTGGNNERLRLHSGGNLQIGGTTLINTDPLLTLGQSTSTKGSQFHLVNNGSADLKQIFIAANKASRHLGIDVSEDNFFIGRDASVADLTINTSGNVGIGTTSPALLKGDGGRVLHLAGSANPEIVLERTTSGTEAKASMRITDTEDLRFAVKDGSASTIDALSIDSTTGNVGIGVTDVKAALQVNSSKNAETDRHDGSNYHLFLRNPADDAGEACGLAFSVTSNATKTGAAIMHEREGGGSLGSLQFYTNSDGNSVSERVRITSDGKLLVGTTSGSNFSSNVAEFVNATQDAAVGVRSGTGVNGQDFITFKFGGGPTACGGIRRDGTTQGPELFSNSDRRIKTNILDMDNVLDKINQLSLKKFDFKDGTGSGIGLIAQDLISIFPSKVKKDDSDDGTGDTVPDGVSAWTIGNNFTYEILKAIQELSAKVEALEAA